MKTKSLNFASGQANPSHCFFDTENYLIGSVVVAQCLHRLLSASELQLGAAGPFGASCVKWTAPGLRLEMIGCGGRLARRPWGEEVFFKRHLC